MGHLAARHLTEQMMNAVEARLLLIVRWSLKKAGELTLKKPCVLIRLRKGLFRAQTRLFKVPIDPSGK